MPSSFSDEIDRYTSMYKVNFDQTYVSKIEAEAHILRAQAISDQISEIASGISSLFSTAAQWFVLKIERNRWRNELYALDDHMLSDLGISRGEIDGIVNGTIKRHRGQSVPANITVLQQPKAETMAHRDHKDTPIAA